jgi:hypothetical protein
MNDNSRSAITDSRLLAAMLEVNPPIEKLMADRLLLRHDNRETKAQLDQVLIGMADLKQLRDVQLPRYIAKAKLASLSVAAMLLAALAFSLFSPLFDLTITATLFASMIFPLWLVDIAEQKFGRWKIRRGVPPVFVAKAATLEASA